MKTTGYLSEIFSSFQGEGSHVGRRHLFVRLAGCNLRCVYCDTPDSLERTERYTVWNGQGRREGDNPVSAEELASLIKEGLASDDSIEAIALTGGEPLMQADFLATVLSTQSFEKPVLLETNGMLPSNLLAVLPFIDIISMDMKLPSNTGERAFWEEHAEFLRTGQGCELYVKVVVDETTAIDDLERAARLIEAHDAAMPVYIQPMTTATGAIGIGPDRMIELYRRARKHLKSLRVLPQTHKMMSLM